MNTQVATRDDRPPIVVLNDRLVEREGELKSALPSDVSPKQFIRAVITSARLNPDLQACTWNTMWNACLRACRDGLLPDGKQAAIVPYGSNAQYVPMYYGMVLRFQRSGQFKWIGAGIARDGELLEHWITQEGEHFRHIPGDNIKAPISKVYALATTKDGGSFVTVMSVGEADKRKNESKTKRDDSAWRKWPEEMYKKTALKHLCKLLPVENLPSDDEIEIEAPSTQQVLGGRLQAATVGERLDQFAKPSDAPEAPTASEHGDGEQVATPSTTEVPAAADHEVESFGPIDDDDNGKAREAYEAGKAAKAIGQRRTSCPGEYRDLAKLSTAWIAGYNGDPPPMV